MKAGVKIRVQRLSEGAAAVTIDVSPGLCIVEGHRSFLVVQEYANFVGRSADVEGDGGPGAGSQAPTFPPADCPVTVVRTDSYGALPVDGLPGNT